jgi:flagella basal body P-ring formation protein FlgA
MIVRPLLLASALLAATAAIAAAQVREDVIAAPVLRANVAVTGNVVRIGDVIDNAGPSAKIPIYRAPDLGTTGSLPTAQVLAALRAHQVIGVDTRNLSEISVTRLARTIDTREIQLEIARALEHKNGFGDAVNLNLTFDRELQDVSLEASHTGALHTTSVRFEPRDGRFDVTFEIANENAATPTRLRFTGRAIETVEVATPTRAIDRGDVLKASDVAIERRPRADAGGDLASSDRAVGMQARKQIRAGEVLRAADLTKPDLVQRDQNVTLTYEAAGLYLTVRGKAQGTGAEGDVVNVLNLQSKRTVTGIVVGRGQVSISPPSAATPRLADAEASATTSPNEPTASIADAIGSNSSLAPKAE